LGCKDKDIYEKSATNFWILAVLKILYLPALNYTSQSIVYVIYFVQFFFRLNGNSSVSFIRCVFYGTGLHFSQGEGGGDNSEDIIWDISVMTLTEQAKAISYKDFGPQYNAGGGTISHWSLTKEAWPCFPAAAQGPAAEGLGGLNILLVWLLSKLKFGIGINEINRCFI